MAYNMDRGKILAKAMDYCARSERCISETRAFLDSIGAGEADREEVLERLKTEGFINELRYARAYTADKYRLNSWGRVKIRYNLNAKGIPSVIIHTAMEILDPDEYYENLKDDLAKKLKSVTGKSTWEKKGKLVRFAAGRGFESDLIYMAVDEVIAGE